MIVETQIWKIPNNYKEMSKEYLDRLFIYNPETGELRNKISRKNAKAYEKAALEHYGEFANFE